MARYRKLEDAKFFKKERVMTKLDSYVKEASKEYSEYKKTKNSTKLAEAGEKLWASFNYLMELKEGKSLTTAKTIREKVNAANDKNLSLLYSEAYSLHLFFYGYADRIEDIEELFKSVEKGIKNYKKKLA